MIGTAFRIPRAVAVVPPVNSDLLESGRRACQTVGLPLQTMCHGPAERRDSGPSRVCVCVCVRERERERERQRESRSYMRI